MNSVFESPNPILFGCGKSALLGEKLIALGCKKALVVFDKGVKAAGIVDKLLDNMKAAGIQTVLFDKVEADPPDYLVNEAGALGVAEKVDGIVGIGGGSSIDTAKGARVLLTNPPPINNYFVYLNVTVDDSKLKPLVVIPTTAGTGSEGSPGGIITDTKKHLKSPILCSVSLAIIDPELTLGLPPGITASTGFDAFCHSVEVITSREPNRFSEIFAREAVALIAKYLPIACKDGANIEAREAMSLAASLGGMALRGPQGGIPHDIGKFIGIRYHAPHGTAVGCLLAETMKFIAPVVPDKLRIVAESMGVAIREAATPEEVGEILCEAIRKFYKEVNMPPMRSFVASKEDMLENIDSLYKGASFTPKPLTRDDVADIVSKSYDYN
jgi:alcohol dehydrogenase class IV